MIAEREKIIAAFKSTPFYTLEIDCGSFTVCGERIQDRETAETVRNAVGGRNVSVLSVEKARKTAVPPRLYDLTTLQRDANKIFGFTAQETLDYLQSDYEKGI